MAEDENRTNNQNNTSANAGRDSSGNYPAPEGEPAATDTGDDASSDSD